MLVAISLLSSITSTRMRHSCAAGARADQGCQLNKLGWDRRTGRVEETEWGFALARKRPRRTTRRRPSEPKLLPRYHRLPCSAPSVDRSRRRGALQISRVRLYDACGYDPVNPAFGTNPSTGPSRTAPRRL